MSYVLIECGEGNFEAAIAGPTRDSLRFGISEAMIGKQERREDDREFYRLRCAATLRMLDDAPDIPGIHILKPVSPNWQDWMLIIVEQQTLQWGS